MGSTATRCPFSSVYLSLPSKAGAVREAKGPDDTPVDGERINDGVVGSPGVARPPCSTAVLPPPPSQHVVWCQTSFPPRLKR